MRGGSIHVRIDRHLAAECAQSHSTVRGISTYTENAIAKMRTSFTSLHVKRKTDKRCVCPLVPGCCGCGFERYKVGREVLEGVDVVRSIRMS